MKQNGTKWSLKKAAGFTLAFSLCISGVAIPSQSVTAEVNQTISIASADELKKIGTESAYPMNGDYALTEDIDLSGENFTPIGGTSGSEYGLVSGDRVFSGTFDGAGHTISGLTITFDGSQSDANTNASGLFAMIGSDSEKDYAEVKDLNFTNVSITHTLGFGDLIGTLAGEANGFVKITNVAVSSGSITVKNGTRGGKSGDLIGVGGIIGETRQSQGVFLSNLYNAADLTIENSVASNGERCGGIIGRIHQSGTIGSLSASVNVGTVLYRGNTGYAINGYSEKTTDSSNTQNIKNCYYLSGSGKDMGASEAKTKDELASQAILDVLGNDYWMVDKNGNLIPAISEGTVVTPIPSPVFAAGDRAESVTQNFTLPLSFTSESGEEQITWTSSSDKVTIDPATGVATVGDVLVNTDVTLTAVTSISNRTKTIKITVISGLTVSVDQTYAKPGVLMTASVTGAPEGTNFTYKWTSGEEPVSSEASYMPEQTDLNKFITVTALIDGIEVDTLRIYCSKLPVVYIDTNDGFGISSKTDYKKATMRVQGNDTYQNSAQLYDGSISIRGRGNSTWNMHFNKLPYKIKLGKKTDLLGFGKSKHWALLANYMDESLIRNTTSYDLAGKMGIEPHLKSTHVELILNGVYAGNYQLVGNVRIEEKDPGRVQIQDWEKEAGDVAEAIAMSAQSPTVDVDDLEDYLNQNLQWITSDSVTFEGKTYQISDYYTKIPKRGGKVDVSGGFLFELDTYFDEISRFYTTYQQPIMVKSPEFLRPTAGRNNWGSEIWDDSSYERCDALYNYASQFIQAVEDSVHSDDYCVDVAEGKVTENATNFTEDFKGKQHYSDLVDLDSLVSYFVLNEFYWNTETMKKSTYMYKDLGQKLKIGPVWDMDWTSNSLVSNEETGNYSVWMVTTAGEESQKDSWYRSLIGDPYFVQKAYECYWDNRQNFEDIVKDGGIIDEDREYLKESANANYESNFLQHHSDFMTETDRLRTFLRNRLNWMDGKFGELSDTQTPDAAAAKETLDALLASFGVYRASDQISVRVESVDETATSYTARVTDAAISKVGFYVNGKLVKTVAVENGRASFTAADDEMGIEANPEEKAYANNIIQVRAMDASGALLKKGKNCISNYTTFNKALKLDPFTATVEILGSAKVGSALVAQVTDLNHTGTASYQYQWKADDAEILGANQKTYQPTEAELGKRLSVVVSSPYASGEQESTKTKAVTKLLNDHLIIQQVFGGGSNDDASVSHSFIELYNPTESAISLLGYKIGYFSGMEGQDGYTEEEVFIPLDSTKEIPAYCSYLIRFEEQHLLNQTAYPLEILEYDQLGTTADGTLQTIANKQYRILLYNGEDEVEDGLSVNELPTEGLAVTNGKVNKHSAVRRKNFTDTDNNNLDFEVVTYQGISDANKASLRPRTLKDGIWGLKEPEKDDDPGNKDDDPGNKDDDPGKKDDPNQKDPAENGDTGDKVGTEFEYNGDFYRITQMDAAGNTAAYVKPANTKKTSVTIPELAVQNNISYQVTEIADKAFQNNKKLKKVTIGKNVMKIGTFAFAGDKKLKTIVVRATNLKTVGKNALKGIHPSCKIKVPKAKLKSYQKKFKKKGQKSGVKVVK